MNERADTVIPILKPPGMTSHDVVVWIRKKLRIRKVGHAGTLDPLAAGLLLILTGRATRISRYFSSLDKEYRVEAVFGLRTDSGDSDGRILSRRAADELQPEHVVNAAKSLTGVIRQRPPMTSAVKVQGKRLYQWARKHVDVERPQRQVRVNSFRLVAWMPGNMPRAMFDVSCSAGTYVRTLIDALGERLGTGAVANLILRTRIGPFALEHAALLEELTGGKPVQPSMVLSPAEALRFLPAVTLNEEEAQAVVHGRPIDPAEERVSASGPLRLLGPDGTLLAVARRDLRSGRRSLRYDVVLVRPREVL